jgi:hypothetical protein
MSTISDPNSVFCHVCNNLRIEPGAVARVLNFDELATSASTETCLTCALIYAAAIQYGCTVPRANVIFATARPNTPFFIKWHEESGLSPIVEIFRQNGTTVVQCEEDDPASNISTATPKIVPELGWARDISTEPNTPLLQQMILEWLEVCTKSHPKCLNVVQEYPARLLDLENPGEDSIRLVVGVKPEKFVALSHCVWLYFINLPVEN